MYSPKVQIVKDMINKMNTGKGYVNPLIKKKKKLLGRSQQMHTLSKQWDVHLAKDLESKTNIFNPGLFQQIMKTETDVASSNLLIDMKNKHK